MPLDQPPAAIHVIDYAYSTNGVFYHGTISDLDGTPKSTWTLSTKDNKANIDQPIDQDTFSYLWNGIADFDFFKRSQVTKPDAQLDFYHFQVIGIIYTENGQQKMRTFLIDPKEADPKYKKWIESLHVPIAKPAT